MFVGHIGVGLALKKAEPKLNLGALIFASLFLDVPLGVFILIGLEQVSVPDNYDQLHYLHFTFPYSHSLLAGIAWSSIAFGVTFALWRKNRWQSKLTAALTVFAAVMLHWICDWIEHPPQLPVSTANSKLLGLGLWNHLKFALILECGLVAIGLWLYLGVAKSIGRRARWAIVGFIGILTAVAVAGQAKIAVSPEPNALAISMIAQTLVVTAIVFWIDRNRVETGK